MERLQRELGELAAREAAGRGASEERMYRLHLSVSQLQSQLATMQEKLAALELNRLDAVLARSAPASSMASSTSQPLKSGITATLVDGK
jgi:hypothetical protein